MSKLKGAAHGGTSINQHLPGCTSECLPSWANNINGAPVINGMTPLFDWVVDLAKKAQERGKIKGIIFHQGELGPAHGALAPGRGWDLELGGRERGEREGAGG